MGLDPTDLDARDHALVGRALDALGVAYDRYFRCDARGLDHVPEGRAILFGNHCGSSWTMEGFLLGVALVRRFGPQMPLYVLVHRAFFDLPKLGSLLHRLGAVLADRDVSARILERGGKLIVFPGGDRDSHKPFSERHRVDFFGHTGFIRLSVRTKTPLVPFVHVGTHETLFVLSRGARIARAFGLKSRLGLNVFPIVLSFPFGLSIGPWFPAVPLPSKVRMRVLPAYRPWEHGFDDPDDPSQMVRCLEHLTLTMQRELDELARARRFPVLG